MEIKSTNKWRDFCSKNKKPQNLVYTTIGFSKSYAQCIQLFLKSILLYSSLKGIDILIICDEDMFSEVSDIAYSIFDNEYLKNKMFFLVAPNSADAMKASIHKLNIFDFPQLEAYKNILFVDVDVLCLHSLDAFFSIMDEKITDERKHYLYAHKEKEDPMQNKIPFWSMNNYTDDDMQFFKDNHICPFNAGMFAFRYSLEMKEHFARVSEMIITSPKVFFFEQAYMNVYFNKKNLVRYDLISNDNYTIFPSLDKLYKDTFVHFCGHPGDGSHKYKIMNQYATRFNLLDGGKLDTNKNTDVDVGHGFRHHILRNHDQIIL